MKKRIASLLFVLLLVVLIPVGSLAAGLEDYDYSRFTPAQKIYSMGGYLTPEEAADLEKTSAALESGYGVTVAFVITDDFSGEAQEFSDAVFLKSPLGEDYRQDFVMLMIDMTGRVVDLYTHGTGQRAISDSEVDYILDEIAVANLQNEDYAKAAEDYLNRVGFLLDKYHSGAAVSVGGMSSESIVEHLSTPLLIALAVAAVITGLFLAYQYAQHRPVRKASNACAYVREGSFVLTQDNDVFLRTHTLKTAIPKSNSGGSGGSSHSHRSGHSHGGGSRKF